VKREGIVALGAAVDASQPDYDAAHHAAEHFAREHGGRFVNPCAGAALLAGQGTVALEILEELPEVATVVVPVGGGGLVGGMAALLRAVSPGVRIVGVQSDRTDAMARSLAAGRRVDVEVPPTLADGLAGQIDDEGFAIGRVAIDEMLTVTEGQIGEAIGWLASAHDARVEGSGAVTVAALRAGLLHGARGPVVAVVSGGNIDEARWLQCVHRDR
jgi:threonine dehydratase